MLTGKIRPPDHLTMPLREVHDAHRLMEEGRVRGRMILTPS
jgi:D-arabinose 1-dehydrogenase-like Zn-dependent alcohol dehydrogenase